MNEIIARETWGEMGPAVRALPNDKWRDASIKIIDLGQSTEFSAADDVDMQVPENLPTSTNSIAIFVVLCILVFGGMAFAKFMGRRERE